MTGAGRGGGRPPGTPDRRSSLPVVSHPVRPVTGKAVIPAQPAVVLDFIADTRNDPLWCPNVESAELVSGDGTSVGSVLRYHQHLANPGTKRTQFDGETTIVARTDDSITWRVMDRFQERDITVTVEPHSDGTSITQITRAAFKRPPGIARWAYPLLAKRMLRGQFRTLARHFA